MPLKISDFRSVPFADFPLERIAFHVAANGSAHVQDNTGALSALCCVPRSCHNIPDSIWISSSAVLTQIAAADGDQTRAGCAVLALLRSMSSLIPTQHLREPLMDNETAWTDRGGTAQRERQRINAILIREADELILLSIFDKSVGSEGYYVSEESICRRVGLHRERFPVRGHDSDDRPAGFHTYTRQQELSYLELAGRPVFSPTENQFISTSPAIIHETYPNMKDVCLELRASLAKIPGSPATALSNKQLIATLAYALGGQTAQYLTVPIVVRPKLGGAPDYYEDYLPPVLRKGTGLRRRHGPENTAIEAVLADVARLLQLDYNGYDWLKSGCGDNRIPRKFTCKAVECNCPCICPKTLSGRPTFFTGHSEPRV